MLNYNLNRNLNHNQYKYIPSKILVCIVIAQDLPTIFKYDVMNVNRIFVKLVTGVMNFKPIMRLGCVIDVMPFIVEPVMKWISVMIVEKWCVRLVRPY
jgi:hypothetical protein